MLNVRSAEEALRIILDNPPPPPGRETVSLEQAIGRIVADDLKSPERIPPFPRSTVDGLAVCAADTFGCSDSLPAMLRCVGAVQMGKPAPGALCPGECMDIPTGGMLPPGADAAVMTEYTENYGDSFRYVGKPCAVYENVVRPGDDIQCGAPVLTAGQTLRVQDVGVLASLGISAVCVRCRVRVGILSTGDELVACNAAVAPGQVRNVNSPLLAAVLRRDNAVVTAYPIVPDSEALLTEAIRRGLAENDILLLSGGSSVGERDAVCRVLSTLGEVLFHGIALKPGKPTLFAVADKKPVLGLPGHPLAAFFTCHLFARPLVYASCGGTLRALRVDAVTAVNIPSDHGRQELLPVALDYGTSPPTAQPLFAKSGVISVLRRADGYLLVDRNREGIGKGETVSVTLFGGTL